VRPFRRARPARVGAKVFAAIAVSLVALIATPSSSVPSQGGDGAFATKEAVRSVGSATSGSLAETLYVSPAGSDAAPGTLQEPLATVGKAIEKAPTGGSVIMRAGSYHESVVIPDSKQLTLRSYPGETVWLDGSTSVDGWQQSGNLWIRDNWTVKFDASPTYERGAPDNTAESWQFLNKDYPMAAHPDQFWIDGAAMRQVGSRNEVTPGAFYVDYGQNKLYSGSNPIGREARASDLNKALVVAGHDSTLLGFGIRRYAPSVPDMGAVYISPSAAGTVMENVRVTENATTGLSVNAANVQLKDVTSTNNGMLGIQSSEADNLTLESLSVANNNTEHFNPAPTAGGFKIGSSRVVSVTHSSFSQNNGNGLWFDESVYGITVTNSSFTGNSVHGLQAELSAKVLIANNLFNGNAGSGIEIQNTGHVQIWNNSFAGNLRAVNILQDARRASDLSTPGHDSRQKLPDPAVNWLVQDVVAKNNVFSDSATGSPCLFCVADKTGVLTAGDMDIVVGANVWHRVATDRPVTLLRWEAGAAGPILFPDLKSFRGTIGQEQSGVELLGPPVVDAQAHQTKQLAAVSGRVAEPVPADVARLTGLPVGARTVGAASR